MHPIARDFTGWVVGFDEAPNHICRFPVHEGLGESGNAGVELLGENDCAGHEIHRLSLSTKPIFHWKQGKSVFARRQASHARISGRYGSTRTGTWEVNSCPC